MQKYLKNRDVFSLKTIKVGDIVRKINNINPQNTTTNKNDLI